MVRIEKKNLWNYDVAKNVAVMFLLGWVLTSDPMSGIWIAAMEYLLHVVVIGGAETDKKAADKKAAEPKTNPPAAKK